ncbi:NAD-dependent histone deacetylase sir2, variant 2 [Purpureocillium takamizusanense]|uniref:NAD-dependent histone deacetylase sir2, variant 2 n=1 Tax=Purpureocillium takamizusanense TaxID=2060973 RepID=A0A9Q8QCP5_9HYPO|nr:NAD-dependent histone deacetylase sir2, variant 2 [Purpureocillium takamizusanense]UNI18249.1 NAD-dependent histone deacetylase sir2, variant 2 [Purpureocillium takamizusanense]
MADEHHAEADTCSPEEASRLRRELREYGPAVFCQRTVDAGRYSAKKLLTAFNIRAPAFLDGQPDEAYFSLLSLAISRELSKRAKLSRYNSVDDAVDLVRRASNIIVITGAGISTSLGIPDFRSKGTGLYSKLEHLGLGDPQEVFDIDVFKDDPTIFYSVARDIVPATDRFTPTHHFLAMLHRRGKLLTNYSQNIDNLEVKAGLPKDKLVQCHGSFGTASCVQCGFQMDGEAIFPDIKAGNIPRCPRCVQALLSGNGTNGHRRRKRKRSAGPNAAFSASGTASSSSSSGRRKPRRSQSGASSDDDDNSDYDLPEAGVMKPDITFFGEALPDEFSKRLTTHDREKVDLVIVIGTSLKVTPVSEIVSWLPPQIPQIYISRQPVSHINFDIDLLGDCDVVVAELCRRLAWPMVHEMAVPDAQPIDVVTEPGYRSRHAFEVRPMPPPPPPGKTTSTNTTTSKAATTTTTPANGAAGTAKNGAASVSASATATATTANGDVKNRSTAKKPVALP